jgi:hypothetical protein
VFFGVIFRVLLVLRQDIAADSSLAQVNRGQLPGCGSFGVTLTGYAISALSHVCRS